MKLEGIVRASELPEIFQMLSSSRRHGVLHVSKVGVKRRIYFSATGVTLMFETSRSANLIGQILLTRGVISEEILDKALKTQRDSERPIGEILCNSGAASPEQVSDALTYQLREELFELLTWENARFEFHENEQPPVEPGARSYHETPTFNVDAVVMEAARRADEWQRIRKVIPSRDVIVLRTQKEPAWPEALAGNLAAKRLFDTADGTKTVVEVAHALRLSEFDVCESAALLVQVGLVKIADGKALADAAAAALEARDADLARALLAKAAGLCRDGDVELHYDIGTMYLWAGADLEASKHLDRVLRLLLDAQRRDKALLMLSRIGEEFPKSPYGCERRLKLLDPAKDFTAAYDLAVKLLELYEDRGDLNTAGRMLRFLSTFATTDVEQITQLAMLIESRGDEKEAARQYARAADRLRFAGRERDAKELYRRASELDPRSTQAREELQYLTRSPIRRRRRIYAAFAVAAAVALLVWGAIFVIHRERLAREDLDGLEVRIQDLLAKNDFKGAVAACAVFQEEHAWTAASQKVSRRIAMIEGQSHAHLMAAREAENRLIASAESAEKSGNLEQAIQIYSRLMEVAVTQGLAESVGENVQRLREELDAFRKSLTRAQYLERSARYEEAVKTYFDARTVSGRLFSREKVALPLLVDSDPAGAEVLKDGHPLGRTPVVLRRAPGEAFAAVVRLEGFVDSPVSAPGGPLDARARLAVKLVAARRTAWTVKADGLIDSSPVVDGNVAYVTSRAGWVKAISTEDGRELWTRSLGTKPGGFVSGPLVLTDKALIATMDGSLHAYGRARGEELWRWEDKQALTVGRPCYDAVDRLIVLVHADGSVHTIRPETGKTARDFSVGQALVGAAVVKGRTLFFESRKGDVAAMDLSDGRSVWGLKTQRSLTLPMAMDAGQVYVPTDDGELLVVSAQTGQLQWRFMSTEGAVTTPALAPGRAVIVAKDGTVSALEAESGRVAWKKPLGAPVDVPAATDDKTVYVATADGKLCALRLSDGSLEWKTDLAGTPTAGPAVNGKFVLVPSAGGTIEAFEK